MANNNNLVPGIELVTKTTAFARRIQTYILKNLRHVDLPSFFEEAQQLFIEKTQEILRNLFHIKCNLLLTVKFVRNITATSADESTSQQISTFHMQSKMKPITTTTRLQHWYKQNVVDTMLSKVDKFQEYGSGWTLHEIVQLEINYNKFNRFSGASYLPLPKSIKNKHAVINVKNNDNQCFKWAVLSALHPANDNCNRLSKYERFKNELNFDGIEFPVTLKDITIFEDQNPEISINVYIIQKEYDINTEKYENMLLPIRLTKQLKKNHLHLLLIFKTNNDDDNESENDNINEENVCNTNSAHINKVLHDELSDTHYAWIKNLSAMIQKQVVKKFRVKKYICDRCLHYFYSQLELDQHFEQCKNMNECKITLPSEENRWLHFKNYKYKIEVPFIIYADIESIQIPQSNDNDDEEMIDKLPKGTTKIHIANSIGYYFHARLDPHSSHYDSFFGENCISSFILRLKEIMINTVWPKLHTNQPMAILTEQERENFELATICYICNKPFTPDTNDDDDDSVNNSKNNYEKRKVRDHCHMTGKFRGAAHSKCNLEFQITKHIPIVFHNLNYDSHFLIEKLANMFPGHISIIPKTSENYISFTKEMPEELFDNCKKDTKKHRQCLNLRFIDSYRFLQSALAKLAQQLPSDKLHITRNEWSHLNDDDFHLLTQKGIYPYAFMDSWEKFEEHELPSQQLFYDDLNDKHISDTEYAFAQKVWKTFNIKSLREYTLLYLKTDVLLLADIFENFRVNSIKLYELDPAHYYTTPGYSWDCMLKYTKVNIELITDIDKLLFVERSMRGGISQCSNRYSEANNQYMDTDYDVSKPNKYLIYFDVNNLYGWAMAQSLPISDYKWITNHGFDTTQKLLNIPDDAEYGYMLEVDLDYPQHLHDLHNDYPFCSEHLCMGNSTVEKLVLTLDNKRNYIVHYRMLKLVLTHGLELKKIHRVLQFKQSKWLNDYIMLNTNERAKSNTTFDKERYKFMNNAIYGKAMENVKKYVDIKLINKWDGRFGMQALVAKPNFKRCIVFNPNLVACELKRLNITVNKPMIVGSSILELLKSLSIMILC